MTPSDLHHLASQHGAHLQALAYRMLGSVADAEDVVQEALSRFVNQGHDAIEHPRAYLSRVVTRLCLDQLKSARVKRETYVGTWLPEPSLDAPDPEQAREQADEVSFALLVVLERLTPLERAAFLLHDVFGVDYAELALHLERRQGTCRKLVERARKHVRDGRPQTPRPPSGSERLMREFFAAARTGDRRALAELLTEDAVLYSDGGGKRVAALNPIVGAERIIRFLAGVRSRWGAYSLVAFTRLSGTPGAVARDGQGHLFTLTVDGDEHGIRAVYVTRNPDKLVRIEARFG